MFLPPMGMKSLKAVNVSLHKADGRNVHGLLLDFSQNPRQHTCFLLSC